MADPIEMKILHMITGGPARTPTFTEFGNPSYYQATGASNCSKLCVAIGPKYAWNHGDLSPDINTTWLGESPHSTFTGTRLTYHQAMPVIFNQITPG